MCLICSSEILCSSLYMMRFHSWLVRSGRWGWQKCMSEKCWKIRFLDQVPPSDCFLPSFDDFHLFSFMWSKSKGGGREDPWNILKLALQINVRLLSAHKIFYKSLMAPGGTWVIKSVKATFFLLTQHQSLLV